ncbi:MAG TPA: hypothetical protein VN541_18220 [Tepidisphaeraceae bacterium]|nr:hypothetical protein [Tepidisphaeraceae bacterium]
MYTFENVEHKIPNLGAVSSNLAGDAKQALRPTLEIPKPVLLVARQPDGDKLKSASGEQIPAIRDPFARNAAL